jgi:hypothetical protein
MSYTVPSPMPSRPATVTVASILLYVVAGLQVIGAVIALVTLSTLTNAARDAYAGTTLPDGRSLADLAVTGMTFAVIGGAVLQLLLAVGFVVLGRLDSKGKNPARIVTWVVGGLGLCCAGSGLVNAALGGFNVRMSGTSTTGPDPAEVAQKLKDAMPAWDQPVTIAIQLVSVCALIAVIVLLALPAANVFFRKQPPQTADPGYPTYPSAPPAPGA